MNAEMYFEKKQPVKGLSNAGRGWVLGKGVWNSAYIADGSGQSRFIDTSYLYQSDSIM
jgi:hypothetical protein